MHKSITLKLLRFTKKQRGFDLREKRKDVVEQKGEGLRKKVENRTNPLRSPVRE
jgi:hypothetical protein